jgi:hypothetical protein
MSQDTEPENRPPRRLGRGAPAGAAVHPGFQALPGDTTVPAGSGLAGLLALIALTGSVMAVTIAALAVLIAWLVTTDRGSGDSPPALWSGTCAWF